MWKEESTLLVSHALSPTCNDSSRMASMVFLHYDDGSRGNDNWVDNGGRGHNDGGGSVANSAHLDT